MIDKLSGKVAYAVLSFGGSRTGEKASADPVGATEIRSRDRGLCDRHHRRRARQAPSYAADKEFDWGDRSSERQLHDFYQARPYWGNLAPGVRA
jgi:hypothetical protein